MTSNTASIHVETGDIFYENHNTRGNFYNFLIAQQNEQTITETGLKPILGFSLDDVENYDLYVHKNAKYLFYRFNDYVKAYGNHRGKIRHTRKFKDSIGMQKIEEKSKQFLIEKIIHGVEF